MKIFFIENDEVIKNLICLAFAFDFLIFMICYFYNKKAYKNIVEIYEKEIGPYHFQQSYAKMQVFFLLHIYIIRKLVL